MLQMTVSRSRASCPWRTRSNPEHGGTFHSVRLDVRALDDRAPARNFGLDMIAEFLRRGRHGDRALGEHALPHLLSLQDGADFRVELQHDRARCAGRCNNSIPLRGVKILNAGFRDGWN